MLTLSSMDIKNQEFRKSLRGLDETEVSAFLATIATQWQEQQDERRRMEERIAELENKIGHYQRIEEALQEAISTAKSSSAAALDDAERRAQLVVEEANLTSRQITNSAVQENERIKAESSRLLGKQAEIAARLRAFLMSEIELLDHFDKQNPGSTGADTIPGRTEGRLAPVAQPTVQMHDAPRETYQHEVVDDDRGVVYATEQNNGFAPNPQPENGQAQQHNNQDDHSPIASLEERAPQSRTHDWQPSIVRAAAPQSANTESSYRHTELDDSWPPDTEEVTNPNALPPEGWQGDATEPGQVFAADEDTSFNAEEPYNVSEDELEKIRRILDDLD